MKISHIDDAALTAAVRDAWDKRQDRVRVPVVMFAPTVTGIAASDVTLHVRIDVTLGERAAGLMRGENALEIAIRETRDTAAAAVVALADMIVAAAARQTGMHGACVEALARMDVMEGEAEEHGFWRFRSALRALRDGLQEHEARGAPVFVQSLAASAGAVLKDLLAIDAFLPLAPEGGPARFRERAVTVPVSPEADRLAEILATSSGYLDQASGAPSVWRAMTTGDIAAFSGDAKVRHLLERAAELRDEATSLAGTDPARVAAILAEVSSIERETYDRAVGAAREARMSRLESESEILRQRAGES